jgi:vacuolar-type H+-ATPase subunit F/Vma7
MERQILAIMPPEIALGFELAGIPSRSIHNPAELRSTLRDVLQDTRYGIVLLHESLYNELDARMQNRVLHSVIPLFMLLNPEEAGERNVQAYVEALIKDSVGYHIRVRKDRD